MIASANQIKTKRANLAFWIVAQTPYGVPCALGAPGVGKTAIGKYVANLLGREHVPYYLQSAQPEELNGIPMPGTVVIDGVKHECIRTVYTEQYLRAMHGNCLVVLDELNHANEEKQSAVQETWLNNPPGNALVIAFANPKDVSSHGHSFTSPVVNRMWVGEWEHDQDAWFEGAANGGNFPDPDVPVLPEGWELLGQKWLAFSTQFGRQPGCDVYFDPDKSQPTTPEEMGKPYPSPRSWENAMMNLGAAEAVGADMDVCRKLLLGFLGKAATCAFLDYVDRHGFPSTAELYEEPHRLKMPPRFDLASSIVRSVLGHTKSQINDAISPESKGYAWEKGMAFLEAVRRQNPELGEACAKGFASLKPAEYVVGSVSTLSEITL